MSAIRETAITAQVLEACRRRGARPAQRHDSMEGHERERLPAVSCDGLRRTGVAPQARR